MDLGIKGRTAIVAAASRGLGFAIAAELAAAGVNVSICARDEDGLRGAVERLTGLAPPGVRIVGSTVDVTDEDQVASWVDEATADLGAPDIAIANAGGPSMGGALDFGIGDYRRAVELSLFSSIAIASAALPSMRSRSWGRLLFVTSLTVKQPSPNLALSNVSRAGVVGYAKSLVLSLGDAGVTVNVLAPAAHETARHGLDRMEGDQRRLKLAQLSSDIPLGRIGQPEEAAAAAAFLCSRQAAFITGVVLPLDGGMHRGMT